MLNKRVASAADAVADVFDGASVMVGGFGEAGSPIELIHALIDQGAKDLTVISNNCGSGEIGLAALLKAKRVTKVICSSISAFTRERGSRSANSITKEKSDFTLSMPIGPASAASSASVPLAVIE